LHWFASKDGRKSHAPALVARPPMQHRQQQQQQQQREAIQKPGFDFETGSKSLMILYRVVCGSDDAGGQHERATGEIASASPFHTPLSTVGAQQPCSRDPDRVFSRTHRQDHREHTSRAGVWSCHLVEQSHNLLLFGEEHPLAAGMAFHAEIRFLRYPLTKPVAYRLASLRCAPPPPPRRFLSGPPCWFFVFEQKNRVSTASPLRVSTRDSGATLQKCAPSP